MLRILTKRDHTSFLYEEMLRGRARVFQERMQWNVDVRDGREMDWYDINADPIYIVSLTQSGHVAGSLRVLPTSGPTMLSREFRSFFQKPIKLANPSTWECSRFCVHPDFPAAARATNVSAHLLSGLCDLALESEIRIIVGVYEVSMERVYRRIGWSPTRLAASLPEFGSFCCGSWEVSQNTSVHLRNRCSGRMISTSHGIR